MHHCCECGKKIDNTEVLVGSIQCGDCYNTHCEEEAQQRAATPELPVAEKRREPDLRDYKLLCLSIEHELIPELHRFGKRLNEACGVGHVGTINVWPEALYARDHIVQLYGALRKLSQRASYMCR